MIKLLQCLFFCIFAADCYESDFVNDNNKLLDVFIWEFIIIRIKY